MKALIITTLLGISMVVSPVQAKDTSKVWTTISDSAPRSVFDDLQATAPRTVFDDIRDTAPRSVFDSLRDNAP